MNSKYQNSIIVFLLVFMVLSLISNFYVFNSYILQKDLILEYNSSTFNSTTADKIFNNSLIYPNLTATAIPLSGAKANYYYVFKKYSEALNELNKPIKDNPNLMFKEAIKARVFRELGIKDSSKFYAEKAFYFLPNNPIHFENVAILHGSNQDIDSLISDFNYTDRGDIALYRLFFATILNINKEYNQEVLDIAKESLVKFPNDEEIITLATYVLYGKSNVDKALDLSSVASTEFENKNYLKAIEIYNECISLNPSDYSFYENIGSSYFNLNKFELAIKYFKESISLNNNSNGKSEFLLGMSYVNIDDNTNGCLFISKARKLNFQPAFREALKFCK